jgi:hypothetical protein
MTLSERQFSEMRIDNFPLFGISLSRYRQFKKSPSFSYRFKKFLSEGWKDKSAELMNLIFQLFSWHCQPQSIPSDQVNHSTSRKYRQITLLTFVSSVGDALTPIVISGPSV